MKRPLWTARILALAGFLDAAWLTASHLSGQSLACGSGGSCELVLTSRYASVAGIPVAAFGLAYYVAASLLAWTPVDAWSRTLARAFLALESVALAVTAGLIWVQYARIHAWCRFCLFSAAVTGGLFVCAVLLARRGPDPDPPLRDDDPA